MSIFLLLIPFVGTFLGFWIIFRIISINPPDLETPKKARANAVRPHFESGALSFDARARGIVLPKDFVGPTYRSQHPNFWSEEEP